MPRSIDFARLEQFVTVARQGSFGKAATLLHLSQPSLTRNMRGLEESLGARLFDRSPRGTRLTLAGERFLSRAERLIHDAEQALAEVAEVHEGLNGQVRVGLSPNFLTDLFPEALRRFIADRPGMNVQVMAGTREVIVDELARGAIDFGLCLVPDFIYEAAREANSIMLEPLGNERVCAFAAPNHPAARATTLDELVAVEWAVPHQISVSYRFESAFYRRSLQVPVQTLNTGSMSLIIRAATMLGMVVLLPEHCAAPEVAAGHLAPVAVPELRFDSIIGLMSKTGRSPQTPAAELLAEVRALGMTRHA